MADCVNTVEQVKVAMWCVPRTSSTVLTKCLSAIDGNQIYLELYSYAHVCHGVYAKSTGRVLPMVLEGNEAVYDEANNLIGTIMGCRMSPRKISFLNIKEELEHASSKYVFLKEMATAANHIREYLPAGFKHTFLIREPSRVYVSYRKGMASKLRETGAVPSELASFDIVRDDPTNLKPMTFFQHQHEFWNYLKDRGCVTTVIDACDLLSRPGPTLEAYCRAVGLPYSNSLLQWEAGTGCTKNWVTAGENIVDLMQLFYERAMSTTHFVPPDEVGPIPRDQLTDDVKRCCDHSMPYYLEMFESRLHV